MRGKVVEWREHEGFGTIEADDGRAYFFHCTRIVDGSRTIEEGAPVTFDVVAGQLGRWEAARVEK